MAHFERPSSILHPDVALRLHGRPADSSHSTHRALTTQLKRQTPTPNSFFNSYYHKLSENVWVWGSWAYFYRIEFQARGAPHVHMLYWLLLGGTESVWVGTGWYLVVLGQYNWVPLGIKWNLVSVGLLCLYILKNMEIYSDVTIAGRRRRRRRQGKIGLLSQWTMEG